jgi:hypothetical protein
MCEMYQVFILIVFSVKRNQLFLVIVFRYKEVDILMRKEIIPHVVYSCSGDLKEWSPEEVSKHNILAILHHYTLHK